MPLIDVLVIWVHLICASIWVGGSIFLGLILAPMLGSITSSMEERLSIMIRVGRRFNIVALPSLLVLVLTGLYNSRAYLAEPSMLVRTDYGIILLIKIIVVIGVLITYFIHIKLLGNDVEKKIKTENVYSLYVQSIRSKIIILGRITVIMSIVVLLLAAILRSGGYII
ncbi:MAG TPA: CopD family protein [Nitrososphaeraceae archaeon]|jgi:putative copper export protein